MGNISMKKRVNACADVGIPSIQGIFENFPWM